jgi:hypothetical protein
MALVKKAETDKTTKDFLISMDYIMEKCYECHERNFFGDISIHFRKGQINLIHINETIKLTHTIKA